MWLITGVLIVFVPILVMVLVVDHQERQYKKARPSGRADRRGVRSAPPHCR